MKWALILRYLVSGSAATATTLGLVYLFTDVFGWWYLSAAILAFALSLIVSFTLQKYWTFQHHDSKRGVVARQALVFFLVAIFNLLLNAGLMYLLVEIFGLWYLFSQLISAGIIAISSFLIYRLLFSDQNNIHLFRAGDEGGK